MKSYLVQSDEIRGARYYWLAHAKYPTAGGYLKKKFPSPRHDISRVMQLEFPESCKTCYNVKDHDDKNVGTTATTTTTTTTTTATAAAATTTAAAAAAAGDKDDNEEHIY